MKTVYLGLGSNIGDREAHLRAALEQLAADPDLARRLGAHGRAYVLPRFERRALAADYLRRLETLVAVPPEGGTAASGK